MRTERHIQGILEIPRQELGEHSIEVFKVCQQFLVTPYYKTGNLYEV